MLNILICLVAATFADKWAVLVAGSNGISNYRHQSDIFRTYKVLTKNGFDPTKIITMAYDDIANNSQNPFPGEVFNVPDGPDVYIGTDNIDYKGTNVTSKKWLAVLTGDKTTAGGKVLESTSDDDVFVFFNDHGANGLLAFPSGGYCYANDLNTALTTMHTKNMYKKLLFYVEACYAGSMFNNLLGNDTGIYVITAANERESSYATYCRIAKYKNYCLSNEFSQAWEAYSDANDLHKLTVGDEFTSVKSTVKGSHVCEYGQTSIKSDFLSEYQAGTTSLPGFLVQRMIRPPVTTMEGGWTSVPQSEAYLEQMRIAAEQDAFGENAIAYHKELKIRNTEVSRADSLASFFGFKVEDPNYVSERPENMDLYKKSIETYEEVHGRMNEHAFFRIPNIIARAICDGKLTESSFKSFVQLVKKL